jgi:hypothetical protein
MSITLNELLAAKTPLRWRIWLWIESLWFKRKEASRT